MKSSRKSEKTLSVSEFKAKSLEKFEKIHRSGQSVTITKRGKPIARVVAIRDGDSDALEPGRLRSLLIEEGDLVTPLGSPMWRAAEGDSE